MKILLIIKSKHRQNTLKIAEAMAEVAPVTICDVADAAKFYPSQYDIVGFGCGINAGHFSKDIIDYVKDHEPDFTNVFVFSTSGKGKVSYNDKMVDLLNEMGKHVLGSFACKGLCKWFIFALVGGIAKGHPNIEDFEAAQAFIEQIIEKYNAN